MKIFFKSKENIFVSVKVRNKFIEENKESSLVGKLDSIEFETDEQGIFKTRMILKYSNVVRDRYSNSGLMPIKDRKKLIISRISEKDYKKIACIT
jgi:hypothetical protein